MPRQTPLGMNINFYTEISMVEIFMVKRVTFFTICEVLRSSTSATLVRNVCVILTIVVSGETSVPFWFVWSIFLGGIFLLIILLLYLNVNKLISFQ